MQMFGKMQEWKSEIFQASCPYSMQLGSYWWTSLYWPQSVEDLDNYDSDTFYYDSVKYPDRVFLLKTGLYRIGYSVASETVYNRNNYMEVVVEYGSGSTGYEIEKTRTFQSIYRKGTTNTATTPFYVTSPNIWVRLKIRPQDSRYTTVIKGKNAVLTIERVKPIA